MGHSSILYGYIESLTYTNDENYYYLHNLNCKIIEALPEEEE